MNHKFPILAAIIFSGIIAAPAFAQTESLSRSAERYARSWNPAFQGDEAKALFKSDWKSSGEDSRIFIRWWAMAPPESSFRVRLFDRSVLQRTDYHGCHYNLLAIQAAKEGIVNWPDGIPWSEFKKTQEWLGFKDHLNFHPWEGDALGLKYFRGLVLLYGLDAATAGWKVDPEAYLYGKSVMIRKVKPRGLNKKQRHMVEATINGTPYLDQVKSNEKELLKMYRREADQTQGAVP